MVHLAQSSGQNTGMVPHLIERGVAILQYVDDTTMFIQNELESARNLKSLLHMFEQMFGLKINFMKREVLMVLHDEDPL